MFTDQKTFIVTEDHMKTKWGGREASIKFRCGLCGDRFKVGDKVRWQYTNDIPGAGGNPFICEHCDTGPDDVRRRWKERYQEYRRFLNDERFWKMRSDRIR